MGKERLAQPSVLHVTAPAPFGGLETVVLSLSEAQVAEGAEVTVAAVLEADAASGSAFVEDLRTAGVAVRELRLRRRAYGEEKRRIGELLDRLAPSVVHTHGYRPDVVAGAVARRAGVPLVSTVHGFTGGGMKNRLYETLQRRTLRRHDAVVAVSRALRDELERKGVPTERLFCIPNAWRAREPVLSCEAAREALGLPPGERVIGWVGRFTHQKGADLFLRAAALLDADLRFSLIGDGGEAAALRALAARLGLGERVRWHGPLRGAARLFPAFDAFALTSRSEGTPMVLFEAMEAGVPIVATRVGGVGDVLTEEEALLVPEPEPRAIASALRRVWEDPPATARRTVRARERLRSEFGPEAWVRRYAEAYRSAIRRRREDGRARRTATGTIGP